MITISIDAMGGDHGLQTTIPATLTILDKHQDVNIILVGNEAKIKPYLGSAEHCSRLSIHNTLEEVAMDESPASALRHKKSSSMRIAIDLIKEQQAQGCVSAGNTGALMAVARFVLKTIKGIDRPAICSALPCAGGVTYMLDLGANVDTPPEILFQFGAMGSQLITCLENEPSPTVGLLNIGVEEIKGSEIIKKAAEYFKESPLNYIGFVEASDIYTGRADLVVCDGVLGNVALKASEGVAKFFANTMKEEFSRNIATKTSGLIATPVLNKVKHKLDPRRYNGASLLGLRGTVVKSHGSADSVGFMHAIEVSIEEVRKELVHRIELTMQQNKTPFELS